MKVKQIGRRKNDHSEITLERVLKVACLFFLFALVIGLLRNEMMRRYESRKRIMITAHRGASYGAPENTRASVALAIEEQADYVEVDVRLTADGVPVLMHDRALFRTTGVVYDIDEVTYDEVSSYDAGCRYGTKYSGETVPCLQEILELYGKKIKFNIELKDEYDRKLAETVVALIEKYGLEKQCVITSASYEQLEWVKKANNRIKTGYIISLVYGEIFQCDAADFFSVKSDCVTEWLVSGAHRRGKEIHVWTVNKEYEIKRMQKMGVDNIITDKPAYVRELLR